jgi:hypothetical protein
MIKKRGQTAIEYLLLSGFIFVAITVGVAMLYNYGTDSVKEVSSAQLRKVCFDIATSAESVYYMGEPARRTIDASLPAGITNMEVEMNDPATGCTACTEIRFYLKKGSITEKIICSTNVNITTKIENKSISQGMKHIRLDAIGNVVLLNMTA